MKFLVIVIFTVLLYSCNNSHVDSAGGCYGYSPDGKWLAEIFDGHSKTHDLPYATIDLWNLKLYPSLKRGIAYKKGKASTIHFEFPQHFSARDTFCRVTWQQDSNEFYIAFKGNAGRKGDEPVTANDFKRRNFKYNLITDSYSLLLE